MNFKKIFDKYIYNWTILLFIFVGIILVNIIASLVSIKIDMTKDHRYSLANGTEIFLSKKETFNNKKLVFNWSSYPYSLGGYSAYKVGQWSTIAGNEKEPINNLFFAGEHCSEDFQGYMNGGAETGRLAAEGIMKKIQQIIKNKQ